MSRAPYKLPSVFVGCPYGAKFKFQAFKNALDKLPFRWYYADTRLSTKHLLGILTSYIKAVDFCVFDISLWNPNVALEIGLAEGLGVEYYILLNSNLSKGVPSDIQGLQRIEYGDANGYDRNDLIPALARYLVEDYTHPRNIWTQLSGENRERKYYFALAVLAHFRENKRLGDSEITRLSRGTYLRKDGQTDVLQKMHRLGLISDPARGKYVTLKLARSAALAHAINRAANRRWSIRSPACDTPLDEQKRAHGRIRTHTDSPNSQTLLAGRSGWVLRRLGRA